MHEANVCKLSDEPVVHRIASSGLIVVMSYITVRNTPSHEPNHEPKWFAGARGTYIDCAYTNFVSSLETAIEGKPCSQPIPNQ